MLSLSLTALGLVTIDAYAKDAIGAVGGLEVSPSTSTHKIVSKSELRVVTTVKSVGDGGLKIFKFKTPTRSFTVNKSGDKVPFTGVKVSISMDRHSGNDWFIISSGKNEHDASVLCRFSATGPGTFTFTRSRSSIELDGAVGTNIADTHSVSIIVTDLSASATWQNTYF